MIVETILLKILKLKNDTDDIAEIKQILFATNMKKISLLNIL